MNSDYTFLEAIHLIIDFYTSPKGYFIDEDFEYPEVRKFIDAGCASLGEEPTYGYTVILSQPNIGGDFYRIERCNR